MRQAMVSLGAVLGVALLFLALPFLYLLLPEPPGCQDGPCRWTTGDAWTVLSATAWITAPSGAVIAVLLLGVIVLRRLRRR